MSVFLGEPSVEVLGPFFSLVVCFLLLSRMSSLHMLDISPLSEMFFANISSHSAGCFFGMLMISFAVLKLFRLTYPHSLSFAFASLVFWSSSYSPL